MIALECLKPKESPIRPGLNISGKNLVVLNTKNCANRILDYLI